MNVLTVSYRNPEAPAEFVRSLRETGFAVIADHPIAPELVDETFSDWKAFFASEDKHRYTFDPQEQSGYFPFRSENAKDSPVKDLKEFFHFYSWTEMPAGMSGRTERLFGEMSRLATELLSWVDDNSPDEVKSKFSIPLSHMIEGSRETLLRPIHYPALNGGEEPGAIRAAAHEDINLITLLPAATAPGLEVMDTAGNWHSVECDPGTIVVNAGDMLQMASEGYYKSTTHRVVNPQGESARLPRFSMPLFLHPRRDVRLSEQYTAGSYLYERLREIGLKK